jgi:hypothetical protein
LTFFHSRLGKPEALLAFGLVTKDNFPFFVPFNGIAIPPAGTPCGKLIRAWFPNGAILHPYR